MFVRVFLSCLLAQCIVVIAEPEETSWIVTTTEYISTNNDNELRATGLDKYTTEVKGTSDEFTTLTYTSPEPSYDPGTKLLQSDENRPEKEPDITNNQIYDSDCNLVKEKCGVVINVLHMHSYIRYRYARTEVFSKVGNPTNTSNQATFSIMLPETAFISRFVIEVDGIIYESYVKKKGEAEKDYQDALEAGQTAAHIGNSARDSDVFVVSVNVAPRSKVAFNLTYEELLNRRLSTYHHTINLMPNQVVEDFNIDVYIRENRNITLLNVSTSDDGKKLQSGGDNLHVEYLSSTSAHVYFSPSTNDEENRQELGIQKLNVEYDVDRSTNPGGDIMLMDGYFVHFFAAEDVPPEPKHVIFVLDTSGSMWGRKLQQLQEAMNSILDSLRQDDYFSLIQFGTNIMEWSARTQDMVGISNPSVVHAVNEINIAKAKQFIKSMEAAGGTNINGALIKSLQLAAKQQYGTSTVDENEEKRDLGTSNRPKSMIVFLTDGIPTVGELLSARILAQVRAVNTEIRSAIFSLAFGDGANYRFLKKLSLQNNGFARKIYEASDAALQLESFYNEIASPLLANVSFAYLDYKVEKNSLTNHIFHSYYGGSEIVIAGKLSSSNSKFPDEDLGAEVVAWSGGEQKEVVYKPQLFSDKEQDERRKRKGEGSLERLWAYLTVRQLLDQHLSLSDEDKELKKPLTSLVEEKDPQTEYISPRERALDLALRYGFVTPLTSLVVVVPKNGSENEVSEIVKHPIGNNILDPNPVLESAPLQNKIMPLSPHLFRPAALSFKPLEGMSLMSTSPETTSTDGVTITDLNDMPGISNLTMTDITWLLDYLNPEDKLIIVANDSSSSNLTYLIRSFSQNIEDLERSEDCIAPNGEVGSCRYMSTCIQENFINDYQTFLDFFCPIGKFAGVCCPYQLQSNETMIENETTTLTEDQM